MSGTIFSVATSMHQAGKILSDLHRAHVDPADVSVLLPEIGIDENRDFGWLQFEDVHFDDLGPYLATGPVLEAIAEEGVDQGLRPALISLGLSEGEARHYEEILLDHHILIAVHCPDDLALTQVQEILRKDHAQEMAAVRD